MWSGAEDETEYETVKWRSTLLIQLFDLCLGCSLKYDSTQGGMRALNMSVSSHTHSVYTNRYAATGVLAVCRSFLFHIHFRSYMHTIIHLQIKSQFQPRFLCLQCRFFVCLPQEKVIYMYNMQLFTLRQCIACISASIKSSQKLTADASAIEIAIPLFAFSFTIFFFFFFFSNSESHLALLFISQ